MGRHASGKRRSRLSETTGRDGALGDLRLLGRKRGLLLQSISAVVVIFGAYFGVLGAIGSTGSWLLFLLVPAGLSGFAVGALLDRAHAARAAAGAAPGSPPSTAEAPDAVVVDFREAVEGQDVGEPEEHSQAS